MPIEEGPLSRPDIFLDGAPETAIKARVINADNDIRLPFQGEAEEFGKDASQRAVLSYGIGNAHDSERGHVNRESHARLLHPVSARAEKLRWKRHRADLRRLFQGLDQFGGQPIPAGLAGDEHKREASH